MKFDVPFVHFRANVKSDLANCRLLSSVPVLSLVKIHAMSANTATIVPKIKYIYIDPHEI